MSDEVRDVTAEYEAAHIAGEKFYPGEYASTADLVRSGYVHGYAQALIENNVDQLRSIAAALAGALEECVSPDYGRSFDKKAAALARYQEMMKP